MSCPVCAGTGALFVTDGEPDAPCYECDGGVEACDDEWMHDNFMEAVWGRRPERPLDNGHTVTPSSAQENGRGSD